MRAGDAIAKVSGVSEMAGVSCGELGLRKFV